MTATLTPADEALGTRETLALWQALTGSCGPEAALALYEAQAEAFAAGFAGVRTGRSYATGFGGELTVVAVSYGEADVDEVLAGNGVVVRALLTEDGRYAFTGHWHDSVDGPLSDDVVYVEEWDQGSRIFHGYVDTVSRRIVQTG